MSCSAHMNMNISFHDDSCMEGMFMSLFLINPFELCVLMHTYIHSYIHSLTQL